MENGTGCWLRRMVRLFSSFEGPISLVTLNWYGTSGLPNSFVTSPQATLGPESQSWVCSGSFLGQVSCVGGWAREFRIFGKRVVEMIACRCQAEKEGSQIMEGQRQRERRGISGCKFPLRLKSRCGVFIISFSLHSWLISYIPFLVSCAFWWDCCNSYLCSSLHNSFSGFFLVTLSLFFSKWL